jgi:hypothetical protein
VTFVVEESLDLAVLRDAADAVAAVAATAWVAPELRVRLRRLALELRAAAGDLAAEESRLHGRTIP